MVFLGLTGARVSFRQLTEEQYHEALQYYREHPGDVPGCARAIGIDPRTARRWWKGPQRTGPNGVPGATPAIQVLALEKRRAEENRHERELALRAEVIEQQAKRKLAEDEAEKLNEGVLKLARSDVLSALGGLARLSSGINKLAERVNKLLEEGKDAMGNVMHIDPSEALRIMQRYAVATKGMVEAANVLIGIERTKVGLPTSIVGIDVANVSLEEALEQHALAGEMIESAKRLGMLPGHVDVGAPAKRPPIPTMAPQAGPVSARERH